MFLDGVATWISAEFRAHGIESILMKGRTFARLFYDDDGERPFADTDLLIQEHQVPAAEMILRTHGFVRVDSDEAWLGPEPKHAHTFVRPTDGAEIDLHWRVFVPVSPDEVWAALREHVVQLELGGRPVAALGAAASAFLVALHSAQHAYSRTSRDVERAVVRLDLDIWRKAEALARHLNALEMFAAGLRLTPGGDSLADVLALPRPRSVEMWLKTHPSSYGAVALDRLTHPNTMRGRVRLALRVLAPPPVVMHTFFPLARRSRTWLLFAYALRPAHLARGVVPALRDWLRARRATRA